MHKLVSISVHCPYCGEPFDAIIDSSEGDCEYIEDCHICCSPIVFSITYNGTSGSEAPIINTRREND